jgi:hypothetical protein
MIPKTGNVSLLQALADCDIKAGDAEYSLNNSVFRDRRGADGNINLNSLRGTVTSMHRDLYPTWNFSDPNRMRRYGYKKTYLNARGYKIEIMGNFETKLTCQNYNYEDVGTELLQHGYCDPGTYNLSGARSDVRSNTGARSNWTVYCASNGYLNGNVEVLYDESAGGTGYETINKDFTIPSDKRYVTVVLRQLNSSYGDSIYWSVYKNVRITKK